MKVLIINSVCGIRSTGRICTDIADNYISNGHQCRIAYGREVASEKYQDISYRIGSDYDVNINGIKARFFDNEGFNAKKSTKKFIEWANNYNPDVLWLHNLHGYYINIELLFKWIKSRPQMEVKWTLHDCWAFTGHCSHFTFVKCNQWKEQCQKCMQSKEYPSSLFIDRCKVNFEKKKRLFCGVKNLTIITPSYWLKSLVEQSFLKEYRVEVVHNSIDKTVFKPTQGDFRKKFNLYDKKIVLGVASAWSQRKGLYDFYKLSQLLDDSYKIVLVGLTEPEINKAPKNILCISRTNSKEELAEIYTSADVFLNLTYEDTYPTVNLEAQACGTPCITYRTGGSVESVSSENVIEQGDLSAVVKKVESMTTNFGGR